MNKNSIILLLVTATPTFAEIVNFESVPGERVLSEGLIINHQFEESDGITFSLEGGGSPRLAKVGEPTTAFGGPDSNGVPHQAGDTPAINQQIGNFFLTDDGFLAGLVSPALLVHYSSPTSAASGVILDIDFDERFVIQARDDLDNVIQTIIIESGEAGTGDGIATFWSFDRPTEDIRSIRFSGSRTTAGAFGLGFDNFNARSSFSDISCKDLYSGTVSSNLDLHMPSLNYNSLLGTQNIWADLEYLGKNSEGTHMWGLKEFGVNE